MQEFTLNIARTVGEEEVSASVEVELPDSLGEMGTMLEADYAVNAVQSAILKTIRRNIYKALGGGRKRGGQMTEEAIQEFYSDPANLLLNPVKVARDAAERERLQASIDKTRAREASLVAQLAGVGPGGETEGG